MKALRKEGDQLHPVMRDIQDGLCLGAFLGRQRAVNIVRQCHGFEFEMHRVEACAKKSVRPMLHLCRFGISDDNARQVVILGADKCVKDNVGILQLANIRLLLAPEIRILTFAFQFGWRDIGHVDLYNITRHNHAGIACRKTSLFTKADDHVADHILLAAGICRIKLAGQGGACQLVNFYHIGFMANFSYRKSVVMKLHRNQIVGTTADRFEHAG